MPPRINVKITIVDTNEVTEQQFEHAGVMLAHLSANIELANLTAPLIGIRPVNPIPKQWVDDQDRMNIEYTFVGSTDKYLTVLASKAA